ncbi:hypothetical protein L208DRAFT_1424901 [Tricholoma matsutake]|nr:hypothetical protein L208DRAFT_1424901 [Tricholoma matsutake 945]
MTNLCNPLKSMLFNTELHHIPFQSQPKNHPFLKEPHSTPNPSSGVRHSSHQPKTEVRISNKDLDHIRDVISHAWTENIRQTYGTGLLIYHIFCNKKQIPEPHLARSYSGKAIANYLYGVQAWHMLNGLEWQPNQTKMEVLLKAVTNLKLDEPLDAAVFTCLTTCFYAMGHIGEFTVPQLSAFDPNVHVTRANLRWDQDWNGLPFTELFIPCTKAAPQGKKVQWSHQNGPMDPKDALTNHFHVNNPAPNAHLFSYHSKKAIKPLTKAKWASRAFTLYLRKHAQVLAPYLQAQPELHQEFMCSTIKLPDVC